MATAIKKSVADIATPPSNLAHYWRDLLDTVAAIHERDLIRKEENELLESDIAALLKPAPLDDLIALFNWLNRFGSDPDSEYPFQDGGVEADAEYWGRDACSYLISTKKPR